VALPDMAQQPAKIFHIGVLSPAESPSTKAFDSFRKGLRELGYVGNHGAKEKFQLAHVSCNCDNLCDK
jgi:hypothetical protein